MIGSKRNISLGGLFLIVVAIVFACWPDIVLFQKTRDTDFAVVTLNRPGAGGLNSYLLDSQISQELLRKIGSDTHPVRFRTRATAVPAYIALFNLEKQCVYCCRLRMSSKDLEDLYELVRNGKHIEEEELDRMIGNVGHARDYPIATRSFTK